ncbi:hypothetical protein J3A83DRAFT_4186926 [Scleroderma citrinum]
MSDQLHSFWAVRCVCSTSSIVSSAAAPFVRYILSFLNSICSDPFAALGAWVNFVVWIRREALGPQHQYFRPAKLSDTDRQGFSQHRLDLQFAVMIFIVALVSGEVIRLLAQVDSIVTPAIAYPFETFHLFLQNCCRDPFSQSLEELAGCQPLPQSSTSGSIQGSYDSTPSAEIHAISSTDPARICGSNQHCPPFPSAATSQFIQEPVHVPVDRGIIDSIMLGLQQFPLPIMERILIDCLNRLHAMPLVRAPTIFTPISPSLVDPHSTPYSLCTTVPLLSLMEGPQGLGHIGFIPSNPSDSIVDNSTNVGFESSSSIPLRQNYPIEVVHAQLAERHSLDPLFHTVSPDVAFRTQGCLSIGGPSMMPGPLAEYNVGGRKSYRKESVTCPVDGCGRVMTRDSLTRHKKEIHMRQKRKKTQKRNFSKPLSQRAR